MRRLDPCRSASAGTLGGIAGRPRLRGVNLITSSNFDDRAYDERWSRAVISRTFGRRMLDGSGHFC